MAGNRLGEREKYEYTSDGGEVYKLETDESLAVAGTGAGTAAPIVYDPATSDAGAEPKRFKPRVVFAQSPVDGARKEVICFDPTADLYQTEQSKTVVIDGETFVTTGRRGEKLTF